MWLGVTFILWEVVCGGDEMQSRSGHCDAWECWEVRDRREQVGVCESITTRSCGSDGVLASLELPLLTVNTSTRNASHEYELVEDCE